MYHAVGMHPTPPQHALLALAILAAALGAAAASAGGDGWKTSFDLGEKAYRLGRLAEAHLLFTAALAKAQAFGPGDPRLASTLDRLAGVDASQRRYAEAMALYRRALAVEEAGSGVASVAVARRLYDLAELHRLEGRWDDARPLYQRAIAIWESTASPDPLAFARCLEGYAALLWKTRGYTKAAALESRARKLRRGRGEAGGEPPGASR